MARIALLTMVGLGTLVPSAFVGVSVPEVAPAESDVPAVVEVTAPLQRRIEASMTHAIGYLVEQQDIDGAWRSSTYGVLRDGITLTPAILKTLTYAPPTPETSAAIDKGAAYLRGWVRDDGTIGRDDTPLPDYPVYSASLSALALSRLPGVDNARAAGAWLDFLRGHQLDESLGWTSDDSAYGGWGYAVLPPSRPAGDMKLPFDSDLSSTLFAIGALRMGGAGAGDPATEAAMVFVQRCQNMAIARAVRDAAFDDGGFTLTPANDGQNKAGRAGIDSHGRARFNSYGSATADGLRALIRCGATPDDDRVLAARDWLEANFSATRHPGDFEGVREEDRQAVYYYWCWSVGHAFRLLGVDTFEQDGALVDWRRELSEALLVRQNDDGTWRNTSSFVKEDDPLIGTVLALGALGNCYEMSR